jgi:hypothetical protein
MGMKGERRLAVKRRWDGRWQTRYSVRAGGDKQTAKFDDFAEL